MRRKDRELTDKNEILKILNKADVCRIAFAVNDIPYIVCMNYGFEWIDTHPVLYFHCANEGRKLDLMKSNSYVCFQLDTDHQLEYIEEKVYCTMHYSSIVGMGVLKKVEDEEERKKALDLLMQHHTHQAPDKYPSSCLTRTTILRLETNEFTAKKNIKE